MPRRPVTAERPHSTGNRGAVPERVIEQLASHGHLAPSFLLSARWHTPTCCRRARSRQPGARAPHRGLAPNTLCSTMAASLTMAWLTAPTLLDGPAGPPAANG